MNTVSDLQDEFAALAAAAPGDDAVRAALAERIERHARRRRGAALVAVIAAVVLVAGGIGLTRSLLGNGPARPAGPSPQPVVTVPDVPLPANTQLIRHQLQPVTSPVTATPPTGLTGQFWNQTPGRLTVSWFDPSPSSFGWTAYAPLNDSSAGPRSAGYTISESKDDAITALGSDGSAAVTPTVRAVEVGGHPAELQTVPVGTGAVDKLGFPASERLAWQLADGRWIHVWAAVPGDGPDSTATPSAALADFAATVTEKPQTLDRTIGIGLTLPGFTHDFSMNSSPMAGYMVASMFLCPAGVDPYGASSSTSSGSGSAPAAEGADVPGAPSSVSIAPGAGENYVTSEDRNAAAACIQVGVVNGTDILTGLKGTSITVAGVAAHVDMQLQTAAADLGNGLTALVSGPTVTGPKLSAGDLAALVASVRLSPSVRVIPFQGGAGTEVSSASGTAGVAGTSTVPSSGTATPVEGTIAQPFIIPSGSYGLNTDNAHRTATVDFPLQNITDIPVTITSLRIDADGFTQKGIKVRLANEPADANAPFTDAVLPTIVAPRSIVQLQFSFEFAADACSAIPDTVPPLVVGYSWQSTSPDGSTGSGSAGELNLVLPDFGGHQNWVAAVLESACG